MKKRELTNKEKAVRAHLCDSLIESLHPPKKGDGWKYRDGYHVWDISMPAFGVRVRKSGRKTFVVLCRVDGKRLRNVSIGPFPKVSLKFARKKAVEIFENKSEKKVAKVLQVQ